MIVTNKADKMIALFEKLGFEKRHAPSVDIGYADITCTRMTDANGNHVDIADVKNVTEDKTIIRMNVDDFEEAYDLLLEEGFWNPRGDRTIDGNASKSAKLTSTSGLEFNLCQHLKRS